MQLQTESIRICSSQQLRIFKLVSENIGIPNSNWIRTSFSLLEPAIWCTHLQSHPNQLPHLKASKRMYWAKSQLALLACFVQVDSVKCVDQNMVMPSGNQTWLAGKSPKKIKTLVGASMDYRRLHQIMRICRICI
jgi:hypothetical protein